jgi:hypothetical protein
MEPPTQEVDWNTEPPTPEIDPDLAALVNDYIDVLEALIKDTRRKEELAAEIVAKVPPGTKVELLPGVGIRVQHPSRRFDAARAEQILTAEQWASIQESKPSSKLAERNLPGALVDLCRVAGSKPTVVQL